jgi:hypothetical protein
LETKEIREQARDEIPVEKSPSCPMLDHERHDGDRHDIWTSKDVHPIVPFEARPYPEMHLGLAPTDLGVPDGRFEIENKASPNHSKHVWCPT